MTSIDVPRLRAVLGDPALARLLDALVRRIELGRTLNGRINLADASMAERRAVDELLGRKPTLGETLQVDLDAVADVLREAAICPDLAAAVIALRGPIVNRAAEAGAEARAWEEVARLANSTFTRWPEIAPWVEGLCRSGMLKRQAGGDPATATRLLGELARIRGVLPAQAEPLAVFATRLFGDAHALDPGTPRAALAVRVAARFGGVAFDDGAEGRRMAWGSVGVLCDELSTPVLAFNLPASAGTPLGRLLGSARADGEPLHVSLRALLRSPLATDPALAGREIFVCENPSILALAADRLGRHCAPLVCINGQFATPALVLLRQLRAAGARLFYHGDFDPAGLLIAHRAMAEGGAAPWRFGAIDYLAAPKGVPWCERPAATPWDPHLADAMRRDGRAVHEEAVFDTLVTDLARNPSG